MDRVKCDGSEKNLGHCSHRGWGDHKCRTIESVALDCAGDAPFASNRHGDEEIELQETQKSTAKPTTLPLLLPLHTMLLNVKSFILGS